LTAQVWPILFFGLLRLTSGRSDSVVGRQTRLKTTHAAIIETDEDAALDDTVRPTGFCIVPGTKYNEYKKAAGEVIEVGEPADYRRISLVVLFTQSHPQPCSTCPAIAERQ